MRDVNVCTRFDSCRARFAWTDLLRPTTFALEAPTARISGSSTYWGVVGAFPWKIVRNEPDPTSVAPPLYFGPTVHLLKASYPTWNQSIRISTTGTWFLLFTVTEVHLLAMCE